MTRKFLALIFVGLCLAAQPVAASAAARGAGWARLRLGHKAAPVTQLIPGAGFANAWTDAQKGTSADYGFRYQMAANWDVVNYQDITGPFYAGVIARKSPSVALYAAGVKNDVAYVGFSLDGGPEPKITAHSTNPNNGIDDYHVYVDPAALGLSAGVHRLRAEACPTEGFCQAITDGANGSTLTGGVTSGPGVLDLYFYYNPGGNTLPGATIHVDGSVGANTTNCGLAAGASACLTYSYALTRCDDLITDSTDDSADHDLEGCNLVFKGYGLAHQYGLHVVSEGSRNASGGMFYVSGNGNGHSTSTIGKVNTTTNPNNGVAQIAGSGRWVHITHEAADPDATGMPDPVTFAVPSTDVVFSDNSNPAVQHIFLDGVRLFRSTYCPSTNTSLCPVLDKAEARVQLATGGVLQTGGAVWAKNVVYTGTGYLFPAGAGPRFTYVAQQTSSPPNGTCDAAAAVSASIEGAFTNHAIGRGIFVTGGDYSWSEFGLTGATLVVGSTVHDIASDAYQNTHTVLNSTLYATAGTGHGSTWAGAPTDWWGCRFISRTSPSDYDLKNGDYHADIWQFTGSVGATYSNFIMDGGLAIDTYPGIFSDANGYRRNIVVSNFTRAFTDTTRCDGSRRWFNVKAENVFVWNNNIQACDQFYLMGGYTYTGALYPYLRDVDSSYTLFPDVTGATYPTPCRFQDTSSGLPCFNGTPHSPPILVYSP